MLPLSVLRTVGEFNKTRLRGGNRFSVTYTFAFVPGDIFNTSAMQVKLIYLQVAFEPSKQPLLYTSDKENAVKGFYLSVSILLALKLFSGL